MNDTLDVLPKGLAPIRVSVIGPEDMVQKTLAIAGKFPSLLLTGYPYQTYLQAPEIFQSVVPDSEVALFTGPVPYHYVISEVQPPIPALYVPYTAAWLYPSLFKVKEKFDVCRVSIDIFARSTVEEAYRELNLPTENVYTRDHHGLVTKDELVKFHSEHYRQGKTSVALTSFRAAYRELVSLGVPCLNVVPTEAVISETLEKAYLIGDGLRSRETQIVVGVMEPDHFEHSAGLSPYEIQHLRLQMQQTLLRYVEEIDGYLTFSGGGDEYVFFTTRGLFEKSTDWCTSVPLVSRMKETLNVTVSMGVGFGLTAIQAGTHARIALEKAKETGGDACFVLLENKHLLGPLGSTRAVDYRLRTLEPELLAQAEAAGMTSVAFNRLMACATRLRQDTFTANELAPILGVSVRSTHRLLNQLVAAGQARVVGEEKLLTRGRPRQVYKILIGKGAGIGGN